MPYVAYHLSAEGQLGRDLGEDEIRRAFESKQGLLWVDICDTTPDDGAFLERVFDFHILPSRTA